MISVIRVKVIYISMHRKFPVTFHQWPVRCTSNQQSFRTFTCQSSATVLFLMRKIPLFSRKQQSHLPAMLTLCHLLLSAVKFLPSWALQYWFSFCTKLAQMKEEKVGYGSSLSHHAHSRYPTTDDRATPIKRGSKQVSSWGWLCFYLH